MNPQPDRRSLARHPVRMKVPCSMKCISQEGTWLVNVALISAKGMRLFADQAFPLGIFLAVNLPDAHNRPHPWLIRVVHVVVQAGRQRWSIDGQFVKKPTPATLEAVRQRLAPAAQPNQRRTKTPRQLQTTCHRVRVRDEGPWLVSTRNVSRRGIALFTDQPIPTGTFLTLELPSLRRGHLRPKLVRVTHAGRQPGPEGWLIGGVFLRDLTEEELQVLL